MSKGGRSKTSPKRIALAEEQERALDLKRAGLTIRQIARTMKTSISKAHRLIDEGVKEIPREAREALVHEIHERELGIIAAHWTKRHIPEHAKVIQASNLTLVKVLGLEAPKTTIMQGPNGAPLLAGLPTASDGARLVREHFGEHGTRGGTGAETLPPPTFEPDASFDGPPDEEPLGELPDFGGPLADLASLGAERLDETSESGSAGPGPLPEGASDK